LRQPHERHQRDRRRQVRPAGRRADPLRPARLPGAGLAPGPITTMAPVPTDRLRSLLETAFPDASELDVADRTRTCDHLHVIVLSPRFDGLSLIEKHKLVYSALADPMADGTIHELRIKTKGAT